MPAVPAGTDPLGVFEFHLYHWLYEYYQGRVIVKRRAGRVLVWTYVIAGLIAVIGGTSALLAKDLPAQILGVVTTGLSSVSAGLVAWNEHYRHNDVWAQRSVILSELEALQLEYESTRDSGTADPVHLRHRLEATLAGGLQAWLKLQGKNPGK